MRVLTDAVPLPNLMRPCRQGALLDTATGSFSLPLNLEAIETAPSPFPSPPLRGRGSGLWQELWGLGSHFLRVLINFQFRI